MQKKELDLNGKEVDVEIVKGSIRDGQTYASEVEVITEDRSIPLTFDEEKKWDEIKDSIFDQLLHALFDMKEEEEERERKSGEEIDISSPDYTEPRFISEGTQEENVLREIYNNFPCTTGIVSDKTNIKQKTVASAVTDLKEKNLVAVVDRDGITQILIPTHIGIKELYTIYGIPDIRRNIKRVPFDEEAEDTGLDALYDGDEEEDEETSNNDEEEPETKDAKLTDMAETEASD